MIEYLTLILAIPIGIILAKTTKDEKQIYTKYFPVILCLLSITIITILILPANSYQLTATKSTIALTLTFTFITTLIWHKA